MPSTADLRRRLNNVQNVRQLTRAMKTIAAARLSRARASAEGARPYAEAVADLVARVTMRTGLEVNFSPWRPINAEKGTSFLLVIGGERGLAGGFTAGVVRKALEAARVLSQPVFVGVGRKTVGMLRQRGVELQAGFNGLGDPVPPEFSRDVSAHLLNALRRGETGSVDLVYNRPVSALVQRPVVERLLPLPADPAPAGEGAGAGPSQAAYIFEPSPAALLEQLLPAYVTARIHRAILISRAGEHAARMAAMEAATHNAGDLIEGLARELSHRRQQSITLEILDILGGAAAQEQEG